MEHPAPTHIEGAVGVTDLVSLTEMLIRHHGLHQGRYKLAIGFRIGVGNVGSLTDQLPGAVVGVESVILVKAGEQEQAPDVVDAAQVNPEPKRKSTRALKKAAA